ncbi:MAG: RNA polymerase sigma factor [Actinobacteria bacterium]|nr:RNA polymerase sigma factor [Actinomycetota bacterium]
MISTRDAMELYEHAVADVYGYLVRRCPSVAVAEDLTAETFLAATRALHEHDEALSVGWLIGTARHKLVDHWRREGRQRQALEELYEGSAAPTHTPDSPDPVDVLHVHDVLSRLTPHHRAALTLRYLDGLPVEQVATLLDRSLHATESLLMRAKAAYRAMTTDRPHDQTNDPTTGEGRPR